MTLKVIKLDESDRNLWDTALVKFPHAHPLNAYGWGKVREVDGWEASHFIAKKDNTIKGMVMVLNKKIPWIGFSIAYAPKGPIVQSEDRNVLKTLLERVREECKLKGAIFLRIDPNITDDRFDDRLDPFIEEGFIHLDQRWTFWNSPRDVYRIDLSKVSTEKELFNSLDRDARRCIRKADREGVTIRVAENLKELKRFYEIFKAFSAGKGFICRKYKYQEALWNEYIVKGNGRLFLAIYNEKIIGGLVCLLFNRKCLAMHMGTPPKYSRLHTYYAYVWDSIRWAKERDCSWYSFRGVGTTPTQEYFKRKFRAHIVPLVGYYDMPINKPLYYILNFTEFSLLPFTLKNLLNIRRHFKTFFKPSS